MQLNVRIATDRASLFAQVLYGRALYTSIVLIGTYWIAVIGLLMASHYRIYLAARRADQRRNCGRLQSTAARFVQASTALAGTLAGFAADQNSARD